MMSLLYTFPKNLKFSSEVLSLKTLLENTFWPIRDSFAAAVLVLDCVYVGLCFHSETA